ncbi:uncharacterized protein DFL_001266 [Arthrobotrys flagrans]|uniref:Uncharacterized protein n=1 Tax=Arthrobotrys flagrans TaxID=97331 RepID=A0A437AGN0_ARTFL|nr:hypothetical protein DFL_001266 [Arthrobotrys flagrans]
MAAIAVWVLKLALEVIFWTLLIALRYRRSTLQKEEDILDRHIDDLEITETNDDRPASSRSITKPGEPRVPRQTVLVAHAQKNWSRPFIRSNRAVTFPRHSPTPPERPPRSPPPRSYPHNLEPSPFAHSSTSLPGNTSPFLNLINRPKSRAPASPVPIASPLSIAEREASKMAGFDEWDISELPMQDRIAYSIAAAEATSPDPGAPPHARGSPTGITTRSHRSSSMPTPPRTPPQPRSRTNSMGSNSGAPAAAQRQNQSIISPTPTSPLASTPKVSLRLFPISVPSQIKGMGINIPLCDSPDREHHSVRLAASPLQKAHSLREVGTHNRDNSPSTHGSGSQSRKNSMDNNVSNEESERATAWQARWAATLERKVTPPMPGFEISPAESMRRMREEREAQRSRQQQHAQTTNQAQPAPNSSLLGATSWIAEASSTDSSEIGAESGMRSRRSYAAPTTPNTREFPRNVIVEMIDEIQDGLINRRS